MLLLALDDDVLPRRLRSPSGNAESEFQSLVVRESLITAKSTRGDEIQIGKRRPITVMQFLIE